MAGQDDTREALLRAHFPRHQPSPATAEYCQLPVAAKAAIAVRLTTDMLEVCTAMQLNLLMPLSLPFYNPCLATPRKANRTMPLGGQCNRYRPFSVTMDCNQTSASEDNIDPKSIKSFRCFCSDA